MVKLKLLGSDDGTKLCNGNRGCAYTQGIDERRVERACKHGVMQEALTRHYYKSSSWVMQSVDLMAKTGTVRMMLINIILAEAVAAAVAFLL